MLDPVPEPRGSGGPLPALPVEPLEPAVAFGEDLVAQLGELLRWRADASLDPGELARILADGPAEIGEGHLSGDPGAPHLAAEMTRRVARAIGHPRIPDAYDALRRPG